MRSHFWFVPLALVFTIPAVSIIPSPSFAEVSQDTIAEQLTTIQRDINWLEKKTEQKKAELQQAKQTGTKDDIAELAEAVSSLEKRLRREKTGFIALASGVELSIPEAEGTTQKKRDLLQELQQLLEPLLDAVHRVSEKPRRIEYFKSRIATLSEQLAMMNKALTNLDLALQQKKFPGIEEKLKASKETLVHDRDEIQVRLNSLERQLNRDLGDHRTVVQVVTETVSGFFAAKGKNLLISLIVFISVLWGLLIFKRRLFSQKMSARMGAIAKPLQMVYGVLATLLATIAVILTLHLLHDWFLVTTLILILLAFAWSSKAVITHFIGETKLALNLGPVKQGERVIWQGIPWLVKSLGFRSVLVNEALEGGTVMLPASALTGMLSRPYVKNEPWFPTQVGDWVQLDDGTFGKVETQTPETVVLDTFISKKHYASLAFLGLNPQNYSCGFELAAEILIRHTAPLASYTAMNEKLVKAAQTRLSANADLTAVDATIYPIGNQMSKIWIKAECHGRIAGSRDSIRRELQQVAGEIGADLIR